jgi:hypothetical protein
MSLQGSGMPSMRIHGGLQEEVTKGGEEGFPNRFGRRVGGTADQNGDSLWKINSLVTRIVLPRETDLA